MTIMFSGDAPRPEDVLGSAEKFYGMAVLELERTIDAINAASDLPAAMIILTKEAEKDPAKPPAAEVLKVFTELVERRFRT